MSSANSRNDRTMIPLSEATPERLLFDENVAVYVSEEQARQIEKLRAMRLRSIPRRG